MKGILTLFAFTVVFLAASGCSGTEAPDGPAVNSGPVNETYIGDPKPELEENYKQSKAEEEIQAEVLKKLEERAKTNEQEDE